MRRRAVTARQRTPTTSVLVNYGHETSTPARGRHARHSPATSRSAKAGFSLDIAHGRARDEWVRTYTLPGHRDARNRQRQRRDRGRHRPVAPSRGARRAGSQEPLRGGSRRSCCRRWRCGEDVSPDRVRIEAQGNWGDGFAGPLSRGRLSGGVPRSACLPGLTVSFKTENGGVRLENLSGRITASTTNGGINGRSLSGAVTADVVNGGVQLDFTSVGGDVRVSTTNGGVRIDLPRRRQGLPGRDVHQRRHRRRRAIDGADLRGFETTIDRDAERRRAAHLGGRRSTAGFESGHVVRARRRLDSPGGERRQSHPVPPPAAPGLAARDRGSARSCFSGCSPPAGPPRCAIWPWLLPRSPSFSPSSSTSSWSRSSSEAVQLPLAFYQGVTLERRYGLSTQTTARWWRDHLKAGGVGARLRGRGRAHRGVSAAVEPGRPGG